MSISNSNVTRPSPLQCIEEMLLAFMNAILKTLEDSPGEEALPCLVHRKSGTLRSIGSTSSFVTHEGLSQAKKMANLMSVCGLLYEGLITNTSKSLRSFAYNNPLIDSAAAASDLADDFINTSGYMRHDFNVEASAKGLVMASPNLGLVMRTSHHGEISVCPSGAGEIAGCEIPQNHRIVEIATRVDPDWILIVEKETVFKDFATPDFFRDSRVRGPGIVVTGKGQSDFNTRHFLRRLADSFPLCKIGILVDWNKGGLEIAYVYKFGAERSAKLFETRHLPLGGRLNFLGMKWEHIIQRKCPQEKVETLNNKELDLVKSFIARRVADSIMVAEARQMNKRKRKANLEVIGHGLIQSPNYTLTRICDYACELLSELVR